MVWRLVMQQKHYKNEEVWPLCQSILDYNLKRKDSEIHTYQLRYSEWHRKRVSFVFVFHTFHKDKGIKFRCVKA